MIGCGSVDGRLVILPDDYLECCLESAKFGDGVVVWWRGGG